MNFFEHQDKARKHTTRLLLLFILAVGGVVFFTALVITGTLTYFQTQGILSTSINSQNYWQALIHNPAFGWSALGTFVFIVLGSAYKALQLGGNGINIALSMQGKHIHPQTDNPTYKKLLNVVTEMALASGNPVPKIFVIEGSAINAFAAGFNRHQTVIAVTEGALTHLNRDELQGVIAHEFSHINFGDVKINMRLVALLHGILLIGIAGRYLAWGSHRRSSSRGNNKQASLGIALMAIGFAGTCFGNIIKAAVSRQREFLADASAVQFTRNPEGIANALKKIAQGPIGQIESSHTEQYSHFYFSSMQLTGIQSFFRSLFATHPEINERIKRLGHTIERQNKKSQAITKNNGTSSNEHTVNFAGAAEANKHHTSHTLSTPLSPDALINTIGNPNHNNLTAAKAHLAALPEALVEATKNAFSARALVYGLLIQATDIIHHDAQINYLKNNAHKATLTALLRLKSTIAQLSKKNYHPLLLMAQSALQDQSPKQAIVFKQCAKALIQSDKKLTLMQWAIYRLAVMPLQQNNDYPLMYGSNKNLKDCQEALNVLFYYALSLTEANLRAPLLVQVQKHLRINITKPQKISFNALDDAINRIAALKPLSKPALIKALIACITGDGIITEDETTLLRMVALVLDCPIPENSISI